MSSLSETIGRDPVRALTYGVQGSAKTTLFGLSVLHKEFAPLYVFDWDLRIASLRATIPKEAWELIHSDPYQDTNIPGEAFIRMQALVENKDFYSKYRSWSVDSMTFMMEGIMARVLNIDGKASDSVPNLKHYMERQSILKKLIGSMRSKGLHFFVTCHEDTAKDEVTGRLFKSLDLDPKLVNRIPGYFNEVWHTELTQQTGQPDKFMVRTRSDMIYGARTSYKSLASLEDQAAVWPKIVKERGEVVVAAPNTFSAPSTGMPATSG